MKFEAGRKYLVYGLTGDLKFFRGSTKIPPQLGERLMLTHYNGVQFLSSTILDVSKDKLLFRTQAQWYVLIPE